MRAVPVIGRRDVVAIGILDAELPHAIDLLVDPVVDGGAAIDDWVMAEAEIERLVREGVIGP